MGSHYKALRVMAVAGECVSVCGGGWGDTGEELEVGGYRVSSQVENRRLDTV